MDELQAQVEQHERLSGVEAEVGLVLALLDDLAIYLPKAPAA
jgi:hypothetical protein